MLDEVNLGRNNYLYNFITMVKIVNYHRRKYLSRLHRNKCCKLMAACEVVLSLIEDPVLTYDDGVYTVTNGEYDAKPDPEFTYVWETSEDGEEWTVIEWADSDTYEVEEELEYIRVTVTATSICNHSISTTVYPTID